MGSFFHMFGEDTRAMGRFFDLVWHDLSVTKGVVLRHSYLYHAPIAQCVTSVAFILRVLVELLYFFVSLGGRGRWKGEGGHSETEVTHITS